MSMIQNMRNFRNECRAVIASPIPGKGNAILALALNHPQPRPHPGAYPHLITEMLEAAEAFEDCERFKRALAKHPASLLQALMEAYLQSFNSLMPYPAERRTGS